MRPIQDEYSRDWQDEQRRERKFKREIYGDNTDDPPEFREEPDPPR